MARKIIILEQVGETGDYRVAFWLDVPVARRPFYANAAAVSQFKDATTVEVDAIKTGAVTEVVERINRPFGSSLAALRTALIARHTELQNRVTNDNPWSRYGSSWDGAAWTAVTVA